jgi:hypothetical protein
MADASATNDTPNGILHRTDAIVAGILIAGSLFLWRTANGFDEVPDLFSQNLPPELFPKLLLFCIIGLSLTLPFEHRFLTGGRTRLDGGRKTPVQPRTYIIMAAIIALLGLMPYAGTIITLFAIALVMPLLWGERRLTRVLPFAIIFPAAVVVLFGFLLKVHLDPGIYGIGLY